MIEINKNYKIITESELNDIRNGKIDGISITNKKNIEKIEPISEEEYIDVTEEKLYIVYGHITLVTVDNYFTTDVWKITNIWETRRKHAEIIKLNIQFVEEAYSIKESLEIPRDGYRTNLLGAINQQAMKGCMPLIKTFLNDL